MKAYIEERVLGVANYILETGATVRSAAGKFKISKSTVHKDVTERLVELNPALARQVRHVLQKEYGRAAYPRRRGHAAALLQRGIRAITRKILRFSIYKEGNQNNSFWLPSFAV